MLASLSLLVRKPDPSYGLSSNENASFITTTGRDTGQDANSSIGSAIESTPYWHWARWWLWCYHRSLPSDWSRWWHAKQQFGCIHIQDFTGDGRVFPKSIRVSRSYKISSHPISFTKFLHKEKLTQLILPVPSFGTSIVWRLFAHSRLWRLLVHYHFVLTSNWYYYFFFPKVAFSSCSYFFSTLLICRDYLII